MDPFWSAPGRSRPARGWCPEMLSAPASIQSESHRGSVSILASEIFIVGTLAECDMHSTDTRRVSKNTQIDRAQNMSSATERNCASLACLPKSVLTSADKKRAKI